MLPGDVVGKDSEQQMGILIFWIFLCEKYCGKVGDGTSWAKFKS